jgi:hypothetical protein
LRQAELNAYRGEIVETTTPDATNPHELRLHMTGASLNRIEQG